MVDLPSMEAVEHGETPASQPHERIVAGSENPDHRQLSNREKSSAISDVAGQLKFVSSIVQVACEEIVGRKAEDDVHDRVQAQDYALQTRRDGTYSKR